MHLTTFYAFLQILLKAFGYRARGMAHPSLNDTEARLFFWAFPFGFDAGLIACLLGHTWQTVSLVAFFGVGLGWLAACIRHASWQNLGNYNYFIMGLITTAMLSIMFTPLILIYTPALAFLPFGMLGIVACWLGYSSFFSNATFSAFGITWCRPVAVGGSEWEEFFIGPFAFGIAICGLILKVTGVI